MGYLLQTYLVKTWIYAPRTVLFAFNLVLACTIIISFLFSLDNTDTLINIGSIHQHATSQVRTSSGKEEQFQHIKICTQDERKQIITEICKKYPQVRKGPIRFFVDHKNKVAYCTVQKAGCSTWKFIMANMSSGGPVELDKDGRPLLGVHSLNFPKRYGLEFNQYQNTSSALHALKDYIKFTVIRHPFNRLLSGFYDKTKNNKYIKYGPFFKKYRNYLDPEIIDDPGQPPTFAEFVSMVVNNTDHISNDRHWRPADDLCDICNIDYQYILKLESMESELQQFISKVYHNSSGKVHSDQTLSTNWLNSVKLNTFNDKSSKIKPNVLNKFSTLDSKLLQKVIDKFSFGIDAFGYSFNKSTLLASCGHFKSSVDYCC